MNPRVHFALRTFSDEEIMAAMKNIRELIHEGFRLQEECKFADEEIKKLQIFLQKINDFERVIGREL